MSCMLSKLFVNVNSMFNVSDVVIVLNMFVLRNCDRIDGRKNVIVVYLNGMYRFIMLVMIVCFRYGCWNSM